MIFILFQSLVSVRAIILSRCAVWMSMQTTQIALSGKLFPVWFNAKWKRITTVSTVYMWICDKHHYCHCYLQQSNEQRIEIRQLNGVHCLVYCAFAARVLAKEGLSIECVPSSFYGIGSITMNVIEMHLLRHIVKLFPLSHTHMEHTC